MEKREIKSSKEDYLEAILIQTNHYGACRVTDVAQQMGYSKASVSVALKKLEEEGCIVKDDWRILLTEEGKKIAEKVYEKHNFFAHWFKKIGIQEETAQKEACMIEHVLSEESFEKIQKYVQEHH